MFKKPLIMASIAGTLLLPSAWAAEDLWTIDSAHSNAHFSVRHMMVSNVSGDFSKITGTAHFDGVHLDKANVEATIPVANIDTRESRRDAHLKSPDFFDASKYPTMIFKSKKIETMSNGEFKMKGDLTIHGVTKEVVLTGKAPSEPVKDPQGKTRFGATATAQINRKEFGLSFDKTLDNGGALVGDDATVTIDVELIKES